MWLFNHCTDSHFLTWGVVPAVCVSVTVIRQSRIWTSGSLLSMKWNSCIHKLHFSLYSHPEESRVATPTAVQESSYWQARSPLPPVENVNIAKRWKPEQESYELSYGTPPHQDRLIGLVVKVSTLTAEDPRFEPHLRQEFFGVESYQWLKNWHSSGYPTRRLVW